jgi:plasmid stabilization system protein ParE
VYRIELSEEGEIDLELIFDHLVESHIQLGEPVSDAVEHAARRLRSIRADIFSIGRNPYQGTLSPEIAIGLRHVTKNRAIIYFDVDEVRKFARVIAVFFGGQDHKRHIATRLGSAIPDH